MSNRKVKAGAAKAPVERAKPVQAPVKTSPVPAAVEPATAKAPVAPIVAAEPAAEVLAAVVAEVAASAPTPAETEAAPVPILEQPIVEQPVVEQGKKIMTNMKQNFDNGVEAGKVATDRVQAAFSDVNERAKAAVEKSSKLLEGASDLTKGNVEALVASSKIVARGVETIGQEAADYSRRSFEEASAVLKRLSEVKSPTELFKLQSDYARSAFDSLIAESSKMSEAVLKLAGEVAEPLTSRYTVAAERAKTLAA